MVWIPTRFVSSPVSVLILHQLHQLGKNKQEIEGKIEKEALDMEKPIFGEYTTEEVKKRLDNNEDIEIIDVREPQEWAAGRIPQAKHIPLGEIPQRIQELDPKKETILVCRSGNRSGMAAEFLSQQGYNVINMRGGMLEWTGDVERG